MENSSKHYVQSISKKFTKIKRNVLPSTEDNLIQKIFGGTLVSSVTCHKCKKSSNKTDKFIDISLEISDTDTLTKSLEHFCKPENLTGNNKYFCEKCKMRNDSIKKLSFEKCIMYVNI